MPDVRMSNFTLDFDEDLPVYDTHNVIIDDASGFIGIGANMTGNSGFIELSEFLFIPIMHRKNPQLIGDG